MRMLFDMNTIRLVLLLLLMSFATQRAFAQADAFDKLKTLAGEWEGRMTTIPSFGNVEGTKTRVKLRVTSMGHVLMHEMVAEGRPDDPITMLYLDDDARRAVHVTVLHASRHVHRLERDCLAVRARVELRRAK